MGRDLQLPDTLMGLVRKHVFGVCGAQGTCLMAANVALPSIWKLTELPNPLAGVRGHFEAGKRWGIRRKRAKKKER